MIFNFFFYDCFTVWYPVKWNLYNEADKVLLLKHINFIICLAQSLHNYICFPCRERPPVLRDHKIWWSHYTGLYRFHCNNSYCYLQAVFGVSFSWEAHRGVAHQGVAFLLLHVAVWGPPVFVADAACCRCTWNSFTVHVPHYMDPRELVKTIIYSQWDFIYW